MEYTGILILISIEILVSLIFNYRSKLKYLKENILVLLLLNIIITIDLCTNFLISIGNYSDGISVYGYISKLLITQEHWTTELFRQYYVISMGYSVVLFFVYLIALAYYLIRKRKNLYIN